MCADVRRDGTDVSWTNDYVSALDSLTTAATTSGSFGDTLVAVADTARCCGFGMSPLRTLEELTDVGPEKRFWRLCREIAEYRDLVDADNVWA